jgi:hypothetical protein
MTAVPFDADVAAGGANPGAASTNWLLRHRHLCRSLHRHLCRSLHRRRLRRLPHPSSLGADRREPHPSIVRTHPRFRKGTSKTLITSSARRSTFTTPRSPAQLPCSTQRPNTVILTRRGRGFTATRLRTSGYPSTRSSPPTRSPTRACTSARTPIRCCRRGKNNAQSLACTRANPPCAPMRNPTFQNARVVAVSEVVDVTSRRRFRLPIDIARYLSSHTGSRFIPSYVVWMKAFLLLLLFVPHSLTHAVENKYVVFVKKKKKYKSLKFIATRTAQHLSASTCRPKKKTCDGHMCLNVVRAYLFDFRMLYFPTRP